MKVPRCVSILLLKLCNNKSKRSLLLHYSFCSASSLPHAEGMALLFLPGKKKKKSKFAGPSLQPQFATFWRGTACCLQYSSNDWSRKETSSWSRAVSGSFRKVSGCCCERQKTECFVTVTGFRLMITTRKKYKCTKNGNLSVP